MCLMTESQHSVAVASHISGELHVAYGRVAYCLKFQRTHITSEHSVYYRTVITYFIIFDNTNTRNDEFLELTAVLRSQQH